MLAAGTLMPTDHYWMAGMTGWLQLSQLPVPPPIIPPTTKKSASGRIAWLVGGFIMPYFFAWRIIFDKAYGFSTRTKIIYSAWLAFILISVFSSPSHSGASHSDQTNAEYLAQRKANPYDVDSNQEKPEPYTWAITQAESLVRGRLKSPSSAKFSGYKETSRKKTYDDGVVQYYLVDGWVESQNSFGAMLRSDYLICFIATENSTKVGIKYLRLGEQSSGEIPIQCKYMFSNPEEEAYFKERMVAAQNGDMKAQYDLGTCFENSKGTKPDPAAALKWYKMAAEKGHVMAAFQAGLAYTTGSGTARDPASAVTYYKKAAYAGHPFSLFVLANHYTSGSGIEKNLVEAYALLSIAIKEGDDQQVALAKKNLSGIEKEMTNAEIEKAQVRIGQIEALINQNKKATSR